MTVFQVSVKWAKEGSVTHVSREPSSVVYMSDQKALSKVLFPNPTKVMFISEILFFTLLKL
jgi:hypothetical protein